MRNDLIVKKMFQSVMLVQVLSAVTAFVGSVVDGIVIGSFLGVKAMAAYGIAVPMASIFSGIANIFGTGVSVLCGKYIGEGDKEKTNRIFNGALLMSLVVSIALLLVVFLGAEPIAVALGADGVLVEESAAYLRGFALASPALVWGIILLPIMQLDGDKNRALTTVFVMTAVNIAGDFLNVFVLHQGLWGMALATTVSYYAGLVILLLHFGRHRGIFFLRLRIPSFAEMGNVLSYGFQGALQFVLRSLLVVTLNHVILNISNSTSVAAYSAIYTVSIVCMALGMGAGQSVSLVTSIFSGERDAESIRLLLKESVRSAIIGNAILTGVVAIGASVIIRPFLSSDPEAIGIGGEGLRLFAFCLIFYAINNILRSYYQAMHFLKLAYSYVVLDNYLMIAGFAFAFSRLFGLNGVWLSFLAGEVMSLLCFLFIGAISCGKYKHKKKKDWTDIVMHIDDSFEQSILAFKSWSCATVDEVEQVSSSVLLFCRENGGNQKQALAMSIAVEEMCMNILRYGFKEGGDYSIDVKIMKTESGWKMRIRDNCDAFDPVHYLENYNFTDEAAHIGINMVNSLAKNINYTYTLKINNLLIEI